MNRGGFSAESVARFSSHDYPRISRRLRRRSAWGILGAFLFVPALLFVFLLPDDSQSESEQALLPPQPPLPIVEVLVSEKTVPAPKVELPKPRPPAVERVEEASAATWRVRRCPAHSSGCGSS